MATGIVTNIWYGGSGKRFMIVALSGLSFKYQKFAPSPNKKLAINIIAIKTKLIPITLWTSFKYGLCFNAITEKKTPNKINVCP